MSVGGLHRILNEGVTDGNCKWFNNRLGTCNQSCTTHLKSSTNGAFQILLYKRVNPYILINTQDFIQMIIIKQIAF